jgi:hypothetical protein
MSGKKKRMILLLLGCFLFTVPAAFAQWSVDFETGGAFSGYNDVQITKETGTKFSLSQELKIDPTVFFRFRLTYSFGDRHHISALGALLRLDATGQIDRTIRFNDVEFTANAPLKSRYRFDSYRLTYRYDVYRKEKLQAGIGLTAKIRDASISLEGDHQKTEKINTGFVPLINFKVDWMFVERFGLLLEGDALAAPQGRAEDVLLALQYRTSERVTLKLGYRLLEGGANVDEVYTFALVNYIVIGTQVTF